MRRFIVSLATSADGFIAQPDGSYDFLDRPWPKHQYGMPAFLESVDTIIMGRKTYDMGAGALARTLRATGGKNIWLFGGSESVAAFLDAGEVDEIMTFVVPVLIGEGIPLFAPRHRNVPLTLTEAKPFEDGVVMLHYSVTR